AEAEEEFRRGIAALGYDIGEHSISEFLLSINADEPRGMAAMRLAQRLLRGADYAWLGEERAEIHAGIGGYYAHVTAPLRRLVDRSEEHTSELQSRFDLVCRLLLEKKKQNHLFHDYKEYIDY